MAAGALSAGPVGLFGACSEEPLVNVRLPGKPLVILHRVQASDVAAILDDVAAGHVQAGLALCKIEEWDHITAHVNYGCDYRDIPLWHEVPFFMARRRSCCATAA